MDIKYLNGCLMPNHFITLFLLEIKVQEWQYWGKYGWGVPKFDETHCSEPEKFIKEIHDPNAHFSVYVWENLNKESEIAEEYVSKNLFIKDSPWIDILIQKLIKHIGEYSIKIYLL